MIVIFSGYNQRAVAAFLRTLECLGLACRIVAAGAEDSIFLTAYRERVAYVRAHKALELEELRTALTAVRRDTPPGEPLLIAPSTEALNRFLLEHRAAFEAEGCVIPLVDRERYARLSDKASFGALCRSRGIATPRLLSVTDGFPGPCVAKPKTYVSSDGAVYSPAFLLDAERFASFLSSHRLEDFEFQEYLPGGESYYLFFYLSRDGGVYAASQENLAQQAEGKSILAARSSRIHLDEKVTAPYLRMLRAERFRGLIMIELRRFAGRDYMIEANPRFWGPSQLFCDAGQPLFSLLLWDYGVLETRPEPGPGAESVYLWSGGASGEVLSDPDCVWHGQGAALVREEAARFRAADVYRRPDTMRIYYAETLRGLYLRGGKHAGYQSVHPALKQFLPEHSLPAASKYERERLDFLRERLEVSGRTVVDIGGNTGYFTLEAALRGAAGVDFYEGNPSHARFVETAAEALSLNGRIRVHSEYFSFSSVGKRWDICLCMNVLHHIGGDFGEAAGPEAALERIAACIDALSCRADTLVLQLGFNWRGDRCRGLFPNGAKEEMIAFVRSAAGERWELRDIGIPERKDGELRYAPLDGSNRFRRDELGEFLNRPLLILVRKNDGQAGDAPAPPPRQEFTFSS